MKQLRGLFILMIISAGAMMAIAIGLREAIRAKSNTDGDLSPKPVARPHSTVGGGPAKRPRTLGELMAANYGWKPESTSKPQAVPAAPVRPAVPALNAQREAAAELSKAVEADDVCSVDRLFSLAGKDGAIAALLTRGQRRMLNGDEEDSLRAILDPKSRVAVVASSGAMRGLQFLDALEGAGLLRSPGGPAPRSGGDARMLEDLAANDPGNGAYAFFALPTRMAARAAPSELRAQAERAMRASRFDTGVAEILELLAKQGLTSSSHLYLANYMRASAPTPNFNPAVNAVQRLLTAEDPTLAHAAYDFSVRLISDALDHFVSQPAARRWQEAELAAGNRLGDIAFEFLQPGAPAPIQEQAPPDEPGADVYAAIRALTPAPTCDRAPLDRALVSERARLRL